jgi:hypothetical protein
MKLQLPIPEPCTSMMAATSVTVVKISYNQVFFTAGKSCFKRCFPL